METRTLFFPFDDFDGWKIAASVQLWEEKGWVTRQIVDIRSGVFVVMERPDAS